MAGKILGSGTDGDFGFVDFDANAAPFSKRVKIDTSLNERLCKLFSPGLEGVGPDGERPLSFVGFEELDHFGGVEEVQEVGDQLMVVPVVPVDKIFEFLNEVFSGFAAAQLVDIHQNLNCLLQL